VRTDKIGTYIFTRARSRHRKLVFESHVSLFKSEYSWCSLLFRCIRSYTECSGRLVTTTCYSGRQMFKSRPGDLMSFLRHFMVSLRLSSQIPCLYLKLGHRRHFYVPLISLYFNHPTIQLLFILSYKSDLKTATDVCNCLCSEFFYDFES
jgi:hypothetical protein